MAACLLLLGAPVAGAQQTPKYQPSGKNVSGREIVVVFISSTYCSGARAPGLHEAIERAKLTLRDRAGRDGAGFRVMGIALDWHADTGSAYLKEFGEFDEIAVGSNWFGLGPETFIWADTTASASIPQLLVYEHEVTSQPGRLSFGPRRVLKRIYGSEPIITWIRGGAPVP
jgi:hypothetical protein